MKTTLSFLLVLLITVLLQFSGDNNRIVMGVSAQRDTTTGPIRRVYLDDQDALRFIGFDQIKGSENIWVRGFDEKDRLLEIVDPLDNYEEREMPQGNLIEQNMAPLYNIDSNQEAKFFFHENQDFSGLPEGVINTFLAVFEDLSNDVSFTNTQIVTTVDVEWIPLSPSNVLGSAGPSYLYLDQNTGLIYSDAQINQIENRNVFPGEPDIKIRLNSAFASWWIRETDNPQEVPPPFLYDLFSVCKHELIHGLGFIGLLGGDGDYANVPEGTRFKYDDELYAGTFELSSNTPTGMNLINEDFIKGKLGKVRYDSLRKGIVNPFSYTPETVQQGSSLYHIDSGNSGPDEPVLMAPSLSSGVSKSIMDVYTRSVLYAIGWRGDFCNLYKYESLCDGAHFIHNLSDVPCGWKFDKETGEYSCVSQFSLVSEGEEDDDYCSSDREDDYSSDGKIHSFMTNIQKGGLSCGVTKDRGEIRLCVWNIMDKMMQQYISSFGDDDDGSFRLVVNDLDAITEPIPYTSIRNESIHSICVSDLIGDQKIPQIDDCVASYRGKVSLFNVVPHHESLNVSLVDESTGTVIKRLNVDEYEWKRSKQTDGGGITESDEELWWWSINMSSRFPSSLGSVDGGVPLQWCKDTSLLYNRREDVFTFIPLCNGGEEVVKTIENKHWSDIFGINDEHQRYNKTREYVEESRYCTTKQSTPLVRGGRVCFFKNHVL